MRLYNIENWGKLVFMIACILPLPINHYESIVLVLGILVCMLGIRRQMRGFQMSKIYFATMITKDFGATMIYLLLMFGVNRPLKVFCLPVSLYFALGFSEFVYLQKITFISKIPKAQSLMDHLRANAADVKKAKLYMEFFLFVYAIALIFLAKGSLFTPISLFNFLKIRKLNKSYQTNLAEFLGGIGVVLNDSDNGFMKLLAKGWVYFTKLFS